MDDRHRALEDRIRALCAVGDRAQAMTVAIEGYGPELLGFLAARLSMLDDARDVFSVACEDMWRGLPFFEQRSSFRTWAYQVTRHACHRYIKDPRRRLKSAGTVPDAVASARTSTIRYLRTDVKAKVARLRRMLDPEDQELIILRVDRDLAWEEVAQILLDPEASPSAAVIRRRAVSCRKRFERAKARLRTLAEEEGLL